MICGIEFMDYKVKLGKRVNGFRKVRSTGDILACAVHDWSSALESCG